MTDPVVLLPDAAAVAQEAARRFVELSREAVGARNRFSAVLSGGSTPRALYQLLARAPAREQVPWPQVHLFWGDERCVPADHPQSNYRMVHEALIAHVPIPAENVYRIACGDEGMTSGETARAYARVLQDFFCGPHARFDLVLLGLGQDGHTASLFPGQTALREKKRLVAAVQGKSAQEREANVERVTLTLPAINSARQIFFLVTGSDKAEIVRAVLEGRGADYPAQQVQPVAGELTWLIDAEAASLLRPPR